MSARPFVRPVVYQEQRKKFQAECLPPYRFPGSLNEHRNPPGCFGCPFLTGGLHPNFAPQNSARPYGVYTLIVSPAHNTLSDGQTIQQDIFQIDVWDTYQGALTAGNAWLPPCRPHSTPAPSPVSSTSAG